MEKTDSQIESAGGPSRVSHFRLVREQGLVTPEVLKWHYDGSGTEEDPFIVVWIENDPRNPMLWTKVKKWTITMLLAIATLAVAFVSSAYSGGVREIILEFGCSQEVATLGVSLFVLGMKLRCLVFVYHILTRTSQDLLLDRFSGRH